MMHTPSLIPRMHPSGTWGIVYPYDYGDSSPASVWLIQGGLTEEDARLFAAGYALLSALEAVEWVSPTWLTDPLCPWCGNYKPDGHREDCARQAVIARARGDIDEPE